MMQTTAVLKLTFALLLAAVAAITAPAQEAPPRGGNRTFVHPGLLHTRADLERVRQKVAAGAEPWKSGFERLRADPQSRFDGKLNGPVARVTRQPGRSPGNAEMVRDANAAYQNALMWCVTADERHARKAVEILNAWSQTLRTMDGHDVQLSAGLYGFKFVNAAELIRHTYPAWQPQDVARFERMLRDAVYPPIKDFATFANGNWDAACIQTTLAIGVFCDDRALFDRALDYYRNGPGNGRLTHYVINDAGQCQESGRDQQHTQLGLGLLADACEIAWNQGVDLYAEADNRLLKGLEYTARYNLGEDVPFVPCVDVTGRYRHKTISPDGRGRLRPIYEMVLNHYENRRGISAPFTRRAAEKLRPEGAAPAADHPGFGTLLFTRDAATATATPTPTAAAAVKPPPAAPGPELRSPNGDLVVTVGIKDVAGERACPVYRLTYRGKEIIRDSRLGLGLDPNPLVANLSIAAETRDRYDATWHPVCGERSTVRDHYNEATIDLRETAEPHRLLRLTFRAYDQGIAFRYTLPEQPGVASVTIAREATQFAFVGEHDAWAVYRAQADYSAGPVPLSHVKPGAERPLTVRIADDCYVALTDARSADYARTKFHPAGADAPYTLETLLDGERGRAGKVTGSAPLTTPWRVVMVADSPSHLLEHDDLILNLNDPCALPDTSWIKPGKVIRETTLTTAGGKACVDFAAQRGLQYVLFDAGWYGPERDDKSDARAVDPRRAAHLDLHEVIRYANEHGIGIILYVNYRALVKQIDDLLPLYESWGVKGVKFGFVDVGSQQATHFVYEGVRKAAAHHLMVDVHDEFRDTGYRRTYPNLMTVEGVFGNEEFPNPAHNAALPFTRYLTGPADYTFCWYINKLKVTRAHQLALSTIYFSPWQVFFWYDRPAQYDADPALDYWKRLPTCWDDTRVLHGDIGKSVTVARRRGREWFVGTIRPEGGDAELPLSFLEPGQKYTATLYGDDPSSKRVKVDTQDVGRETVLKTTIAPNGGQVVWIAPK